MTSTVLRFGIIATISKSGEIRIRMGMASSKSKARFVIGTPVGNRFILTGILPFSGKEEFKTASAGGFYWIGLWFSGLQPVQNIHEAFGPVVLFIVRHP